MARHPLVIYCPFCGEKPRQGPGAIVGVICRECRGELEASGYTFSPGNDPLFIVPRPEARVDLPILEFPGIKRESGRGM